MADQPWYHAGPTQSEWAPAIEPRRATAIGDVAAEAFGIYFGNEAMDKIERLMRRSPGAVAGLLLGYTLRGRKRPFVLISDILPSPDLPQGDGQVLFTPAALEKLQEAYQAAGTDSRVVGWFHAREQDGPVGITPYERYTHERYFGAPHHIALVIESRRKASRVYRAEGGTLRPCDAYYFWNSRQEPVTGLIGRAVGMAITIESAAASELPAYASSEPEERAALPRLWWAVLIAAFLAYLLIPGAPGSLWWLERRSEESTQELQALATDLATLQAEALALQAVQASGTAVGAQAGGGAGSAQASTQTSGTAGSTQPGGTAGSTRIGGTPGSTQTGGTRAAASSASSQTVSSSGQATGTSSRASTASAAPSTTLSLGESGALRTRTLLPEDGGYVIQPGDTMWRISSELLGDPWKFETLARTNNIPDPNLIYPGQRITLPTLDDGSQQ